MFLVTIRSSVHDIYIDLIACNYCGMAETCQSADVMTVTVVLMVSSQ